jgi:hypothetical protein
MAARSLSSLLDRRPSLAPSFRSTTTLVSEHGTLVPSKEEFDSENQAKELKRKSSAASSSRRSALGAPSTVFSSRTTLAAAASQALGRRLSLARQSLDVLISRAADALGYGPSGAMRRVLLLLRHAHARICADERVRRTQFGALWMVRAEIEETAKDDEARTREALLGELVEMACVPCPACRTEIIGQGAATEPVRAQLAKLLDFAR